MVEINYEIKKQDNGWYLATADFLGDSIIVEDKDYVSLKQKIKRMTSHHLDVSCRRGVPVPKNPKIRLIYLELLFENPEAEKILIVGGPENGGYSVKANTLLSLDLYHKDFDSLRKQLIQRVQEHGDKHIEFKLEEVLQ